MDLVVDPLVEKLENFEIAYIDGPPKFNQGSKLKIRAAFFEHSKNKEFRGNFIIVPGRTEYIEKYAQIILDLTGRGFNCLCIDPRGQGLSDRIGAQYYLGDIDSYENSAIHLNEAIKYFDARLVGKRFLISHSMGGLIVLTGLVLGLFGKIDGAVFNTPLWAFKPSRILKAMIYLLHNIGLGGKTAPSFNVKWRAGNFYTNDLTSDKKRFARNSALMLREPKLQLGGPTNNWFYAAFKAFKKYSNANLEKITMPILVLQAGFEDLIDNVEQSNVAHKMPNAQIALFKDGKHELLMERDEIRNQIFEKIDEFIAPLA